MSEGRHIANKKDKSEAVKKKRAKKQMKKLNKILLIIFIIIFVVNACIMVFWLKSNYDLSKIEEDVINKVVTENSGTDENQDGRSVKVDFKALEEINQDIKAWIYIKDTDINYPVLQSEDNEYYLKRNIYKKYSSAGSLFLDANNKIDFTDENTIIYGHNLRNKKMFADIAKIYNGDLGNTVEVEIYTKDKFEKYEVVSVYSEEPSIAMIKKSFSSNQERKLYMENCISKSKTKFNYTSTDYNNILTLVTCDASGYNRIVLNAQKK